MKKSMVILCAVLIGFGLLGVGNAQATVIQWRIDFSPTDEPLLSPSAINVQSGYATVKFDTESTRVNIDTETTDVIQWWAMDYKVVMDGVTFLPDAQILPNGQPLSVVGQEEKRIGLTQGPRERIVFDFELQNGAFFNAYLWSEIWDGGSKLLTNGVYEPTDIPIYTDNSDLGFQFFSCSEMA